jgi:hypothetical protein
MHPNGFELSGGRKTSSCLQENCEAILQATERSAITILPYSSAKHLSPTQRSRLAVRFSDLIAAEIFLVIITTVNLTTFLIHE